MLETAPLRGHAVIRRLLAIFAEVGPTITYDMALSRLREYRCRVCRPTFDKHYRRTFNTDVPTVLEPIPAAPIDSKPTLTPDPLSAFIRFSLAVEQAGGIDTATHYLNVLRDLNKVLPQR